MATAPARRPGPLLRRSREGAVVAGVCAGLGRAFGIAPLWIRVGFVAATLASGVGALVYLVCLVALPVDEGGVPARRLQASLKESAGIGLLVLAALLTLRALGIWWSDVVVWPLTLTGAGLAVIWRQSTGAQEAPGAAPAPAEGDPAARLRTPLGELPRFGVRLVAGAGLVAAGLVVLLSSVDALGTIKDVAIAAAVVVAGVTLIFGTSWLGLLTALREERAERIRSQERAEMAAHLHDSVLQTLALIQRRAGDDPEVATLARRQERELRDWLAGREAAAGPDGAATLAAALQAAAAEVEAAHRVEVDVVTVGDAPLDERMRAVAGAAREAAVNAAKFAGTGHVDLYAEASPQRVEVYVRDRGAGFDPAAVDPARRGLRESILARMARHGGRATVRSAAGEGTEVELVMDR